MSDNENEDGSQAFDTVLIESQTASGTPILQEELLPGWKEATTPDGRIYYWNTTTKETRWEKPVIKHRRAQFATRSRSSANLDELFDERWFFGGISRTEAELILGNLQPTSDQVNPEKGAMLIRENKVPAGSFYISKIIFSTRLIKHQLIVHDPVYGYLFENTDLDKNNYKYLKQLVHRSPECQGFASARTLLTISQRAQQQSLTDFPRRSSNEAALRKSSTESPTRKSSTESPTRKSSTDSPTRKSSTESPIRKSSTDSPIRKSSTDSTPRKSSIETKPSLLSHSPSQSSILSQSRNNSSFSGEDDIPKEERLRLNVIDEVINTERDYANDLQKLIEHYVIPLSTKEGKSIVTNENYCNLFSNITELLDISYSVLNLLEEIKRRSAKKTTYIIGDVFCKLADDFKAYTVYCVYQTKALKTYEKCHEQKAFLEFEKKNDAKPELKGIGLLGYLIKPVQRICKYPILLKELLKYTPETHIEYSNLVAALDKIEQVVSYINENKKLTDNVNKLTEIKNKTINLPTIADFVKPIRFVVMEENFICLQKVARGANNQLETKNLNKECLIYLMTDMLLCVKKSKKKDKYKFISHITVDKLRITDVYSDTEFNFEVVNRDDDSKLVLSASNQAKKKKFVEEAKRIQKENYLENQAKLMKEAEQFMQSFEFRHRTMNEKRLNELKNLSSLFGNTDGTKTLTDSSKKKLQSLLGSN